MKEHHLSRSNPSSRTSVGRTPNPLQPRPFAPAPDPLALDPSVAVPDAAPRTFSIQYPIGTPRISIQPKLTIGAPGDKYEQEADRVAAQVVQQISAPPVNQLQSVQRDSSLEEDELQMKPMIQRLEMPEEDELQMKSTPSGGIIEGEAAPALETEIQQARGSGQALAPHLQIQMGQAMGADFSNVRVHTDSQSDQLNRSIQAKAFTTGQDIFFRQGAYQPGNRGGQELIAHELTHVVQQNTTNTASHKVNSNISLQCKNGNPKPKRTATTIKANEKDQLERFAKDDDTIEFQKLAEELYEKEPKYYTDLLVYKLNKHKDDSSKRSIWLNRSPEKARDDALARIYGNQEQEDALLSLEDAVEKGESYTIGFLYKQHNKEVFRVFIDNLRKHRNNQVEQAKWSSSAPSELSDNIFKYALSEEDADLVSLYSNKLKTLSVDEAVGIVKKVNAVFFIENILNPLKQDNAILQLLKSQDILSTLREKDPQAFSSFVDETPQLSVIKKAQESLPKDKVPSAKEIVDSIFDSFVKKQGIDISYYTNRFDEDRIILTGGTARDKKDRESRVQMSAKITGQSPDSPSTQCHNLLAVLRHIMETYPNLALDITSAHIENMLLTKDIGDGLIKSGFGGNVLDEQQEPTGKIIFTGDDEGKQSHTWLVINGIAYDPVMGTKGAAVSSSKDAEFAWVPKYKRQLAKEMGGERYLVKKEGLQAPSNPHGFISAYILTTKPDTYGFEVP